MVFSPSPLRGEGRGGGGVFWADYSHLPKSPPSHRGEGEILPGFILLVISGTGYYLRLLKAGRRHRGLARHHHRDIEVQDAGPFGLRQRDPDVSDIDCGEID
jgi:hypothetical protein